MREDWAETTIGNVADYLNGRGFKKSEWETEGLPIIRIQNLNKKDAPFNYTSSLYDEKYSVKNGDLLFSWSASLGVYIWNRGDAWLNQHIFKVAPKDFILKDYLLHKLQSIIQLLYSQTHGSGMVHITKRNFEATKFLLPPLPEQRAIVAKIEELFSGLDKGEEDLKKAQEQLKIYRQAVLKKAFEGGLTEGNQGNWSELSFEELTLSLKRGPFGGDLKKAFFVDSGFAVYEQQHAINNDFTNIRYFIDAGRFNKLKACEVGPGDYIVSCSGTMGKISRLPENSPEGVINQALLRIRINDEVITHDYFLHLFRSSLFQRKILKDSRGSGMQNMAGIKELKPIPVKLPGIHEQYQIVQEIESRLSVCDSIEASISESLDKSKALRQSILKKAFEGTLLSEEEIAACKAAPDYEPASVLLERIKAEKKKK